MTAVVATVLSLAPLVVAPAGAAKNAAHYYVDGVKVEQAQGGARSLVRDLDGRSHVASIHNSQRLHYYTRSHGSTLWHMHTVAAMTYHDTYSDADLALSPDGSHLYLAADCASGPDDGLSRGIYIISKPVGRANFSAPSSADRVRSWKCKDSLSGEARIVSDQFILQDLVGLGHGRVGVLYLVNSHSAHSELRLATGVPGHRFHVHAFTGVTRGEVQPHAQIARDHATGDLVMAQYMTVHGVYGLYIYTRRSGHAWSGPHRLETADPTSQRFASVAGLAVAHGRVWIGVKKLVFTRATNKPTQGAWLFSRQRGSWSGPTRLHGTGQDDIMGPIALTDGGWLHVLYVSTRQGHGGIRHLLRSPAGHWSSAGHVTSNINDVPEDLAAVPHGGFRYSCVCYPPGH